MPQERQFSFSNNNNDSRRHKANSRPRDNGRRPTDHHAQENNSYNNTQDRPRVNHFEPTCFDAPALELLFRKYLRVRQQLGWRGPCDVFFIGEAAEVLRGLAVTCQSVQLLVIEKENPEPKVGRLLSVKEDSNFAAVLPYASELKDVEAIPGYRMSIHGNSTPYHLTRFDGKCVVAHEAGHDLELTWDQTVYENTGIKIPTLQSAVVLWETFGMGRSSVFNIMEIASEANTGGFMEEKDYSLFGRIAMWKKYGAKEGVEKRDLMATINERDDREMWLDAMN